MLRKDLTLDRCEIKFSANKPTQFKGYASMFGGVDQYGDTILRGAYSETISNRSAPILMLYGHNPGRVIGKWINLQEDDKGLLADGELTPGNTESENVAALMKHGAINGLSIGYRVSDGGEQMSADGRLRVLSKIDLLEISVVSMPADDGARIDLSSVKSQIDALTSISAAEDFLRDAGGFSRNAAKTFLSQLKTVYLRDAGAASISELTLLKERIIALEAAKLAGKFALPTFSREVNEHGGRR